MKKLSIATILTLVMLPLAAYAQGNHEYSPLVEKTVNYKNWSLPNLQTEKNDDLRVLMKDKKLVMIVYFAPWCGNWKNEAPVAARLYEKYKAQGLEIIGVGEYGSRDEVRNYFGPAGAPYPVVMESEGREARETTSHYGYRQLTGDKRRWGSPWNIFLEPAKLNPTGETVTEKAWVVNGELIEAEADKFISERLKAKTAAIVPCTDPE